MRRTREHPDLRVGSSVRGALDATAVVDVAGGAPGAAGVSAVASASTPSLVALSGRVRLREGCVRTAEEIITELWREVFGARPAADDGDGAAGKARAPTGARLP